MIGRMIVMVGVLVVSAVAMGQPMSDRVPEGAMVYVGWAGSEGMPGGYAQSHLKAVLESSNVAAVFNDMLPRLMQKMGQRDGEAAMVWQLASAIGGPMWRHSSAVYFAGVDFRAAAGPSPRVGIICQAGKDADGLFGQLKGLVDGPLAGAPFPVKVFRVGDIVGIATGYDDEELAMAGKESPKRPKAISVAGKFVQALGQVQKDAVVVAYVDVEAMVGLIDEGVRLSDDPQELAQWQKARDGLGLGGVQRVIMTGGFEGRDWTWQGFVGAPNPRTGLVGLIGGKALSDATLKLVPVSATAMEAAGLDLVGLMDGVRSVGAGMDAEFGKQFDATVAQINQSLGMDLRKDLLAAFGSEWVSYSDPASTGSGAMGTVLANRLAKAAEVEKGLTKLEGWINQEMANAMKGEKVKIAIESSQINGMDVHTLKVPLVAPSWAIKDGVFYAGLYPQVVVVAAGNKGKSILENESFVGLRKRLGGQNAVTISYVDLPKTAPGAYQVVLPLVQLGVGFADLYGVKTPPLVVPPLGALMGHLSATEDCFWTDNAGWHYKALTPFPGAKVLASDANIGVASAAMAASILLPAVSSARERAMRVKCMSNMIQIGRGIMLYANDNKGKFPADFGTLVTTADMHPEVFVCPGRGTGLPAGVAQNVRDPAKLAAAAKWVNEHADYVYVGAKLNNNAPADVILAYEKPENHGGQGINMLFGDGHVEWVRMPAAMERVKKQEGK
ncbi:MAG: hypothetical protein NTU53_08885 [Planctomycetota bacterium]|nr:hypothetical protein [Planctomycetota bacterium]